MPATLAGETRRYTSYARCGMLGAYYYSGESHHGRANCEMRQAGRDPAGAGGAALHGRARPAHLRKRLEEGLGHVEGTSKDDPQRVPAQPPHPGGLGDHLQGSGKVLLRRRSQAPPRLRPPEALTSAPPPCCHPEPLIALAARDLLFKSLAIDKCRFLAPLGMTEGVTSRRRNPGGPPAPGEPPVPPPSLRSPPPRGTGVPPVSVVDSGAWRDAAHAATSARPGGSAFSASPASMKSAAERSSGRWWPPP